MLDAMALAPTVQSIGKQWNDQSLQPDLARATRGTLGFMIPLLLAAFTSCPLRRRLPHSPRKKHRDG